jgi:hypothetical protein
VIDCLESLTIFSGIQKIAINSSSAAYTKPRKPEVLEEVSIPGLSEATVNAFTQTDLLMADCFAYLTLQASVRLVTFLSSSKEKATGQLPDTGRRMRRDLRGSRPQGV